VFENQTCAIPFSLSGREVSAVALGSRKEDYMDLQTGEIIEVPDGVRLLTCGVDVQADRLEMEVVGWGQYGETWSLAYNVIYGNADFLGDGNLIEPNTKQLTVWGVLDQFLAQRFRGSAGRLWPIECTLIDSGDGKRTEVVEMFCLTREGRRIYASKGDAGNRGKGFITRPKKRSERWKTWNVMVHTSEIKELLYKQMSVAEPGPGHCHFPNLEIYDGRYFTGLTCERRVEHRRNGRVVLVWETPSGARNEPLDCRVYAFAAKHFYDQADRLINMRSGQPAEQKPAKPVAVQPARAARPIGTVHKGVWDS
jgi:phage terminase large subunit GpA-like protein